MSTPAIDRAEVARTLHLLHRPGDVFEVRAPLARDIQNGGRTERYEALYYGYFDSPDLAANATTVTFESALWPALYVGLNPVNPALLARAANRIKKQTQKGGNTPDTEVHRRRWLLVDVDPQRPAGISATDDEKAAAQHLTHRIRLHLLELGWPAPIVADSGNGWHLLFRVDLPGADDGLVTRCLKELADTFDTSEVKVDKTVGNASRITKLYGSVVRKGDHTADRPHRMSGIRDVPEPLEHVPEALIRTLGGPKSTAPSLIRPGSLILSDTSGSFDLDAFIRRHIPQAGEAELWEGGSRWIVDPCLFNPEHTGSSAAIVRACGGPIAYTCKHNGCASRTWRDVREMFEPQDGRAAPFRQREGHSSAAPEPWSEPVSFDSPTLLPDFPIEALPSDLGDFALEIAKTVQVPVDLSATLALSVASAAVARRYVVVVGETHEEPVNLYVVGAMPPGTRKSETFSRVVAPLESLEEELVLDAKPGIAKATARREADEARMKELKSKIARKAKDADAACQELEELSANLAEVPVLPQVIVGDETSEHLASTLAAQGGRLALFDADAGLFEILAGRYSSAPNFEVYLKGHAGDTIRVGRSSRDRDFVKRPALTIGICVQPAVISALASTPGFRGRGLLGRFLYTIPEDLVGTRRYMNRPISARAAGRYSCAIKSMFKLPTAGENQAHRLILAGPALREWASFADRVEREQREGERLACIRDWASKAAGAAARIAGIFHVLRYRECRPAAPWEVEIGVEDVVCAVALMDYFTEHALAAYGLMETDERVGLAKRLLRWVERFISDSRIFRLRGERDELGFTLRDCHRHHRSIGRPEDLLPGLDLLESRGYLRRLPPPATRPAHRPPSTVFLVSPLLSIRSEVPGDTTRATARSAGA